MSASVSLYGGDVRLTFDDALHAYTAHLKNTSALTDGKFVPGVTKILGCLDKPALIQWAANMAGDYPLVEFDRQQLSSIDRDGLAYLCKEAKTAHRKFSKAATDIGKEVHAFAERALVDQRVKMPIDPQARKGAEAFLGWLHATDMQPINIERMCFSQTHWYAGTCDFYGHINGDMAVMDLKTSSGLYPEMLFQLAAYAIAISEETGERIDHGWIIRLDKKTGRCEPHYIPLRQKLKSGFLSVKAAYDATKVADALVDEVKQASKEGRRACLTSTLSSTAAASG